MFQTQQNTNSNAKKRPKLGHGGTKMKNIYKLVDINKFCKVKNLDINGITKREFAFYRKMQKLEIAIPLFLNNEILIYPMELKDIIYGNCRN